MSSWDLSAGQLHPDPHLGPLKHDHKLTLIFFSLDEDYYGDRYPWIKRGDPDVIWPRDWLPKEEEGLGDNILVLSVDCYIDHRKESWLDLDLGNKLVQYLVMNPRWQLDRPQTIMLVGHGAGGLLLKSFTMEVEKLSKVDNANGELQQATCKAFQQNIKGIVFYSVPHTTSQEECAHYWKSHPQRFSDFPKQFSQDMVLVNRRFEKSIKQRWINLYAFVEGQKVSISQSSTSKLTRNNVCTIIDADYIQVCQPLDQQHISYKRFLEFIQFTLDDVEQLNTKFNLKDSQGLNDQSTSIGPSSAVQKPHLPREAKREVGTSTRTNETKGVPDQQQKLDVMIRTNETEGVPNQQQKLDVMIKTNEIEGVPNQQQRLDVMIRTNEAEGVPNQQQKLDVMIKTIEDVHIKSPKDLQSLAPEEVLGKTSILCVGGKVEKGDSVEFLFMDVGDMAKVVGVGLNWAKVVVTKEFAVNVMQEDEGTWTKLWCLEHFVPRIITIPNLKQELVKYPNSAKTDGVELEANLGRVYVEDDKEENAHACFPLVFELAEHIGLGRKSAMKMKKVSGAKSSGSTKGGEISGAESSGPTEGGEASGVKSSGSTKDGEVSGEKSIQSSRQQSSNQENDEGYNDTPIDPPNPKDPTPSIDPQEEKTLTVSVYPRPQELSKALKGLKKPPCICPTLKFTFERKGEWRRIVSEATTECNFGSMKSEPIKNDFEFYQDYITICLECTDVNAARVTKRSVQAVQYVTKTKADTSTRIENSGYQYGINGGGGGAITFRGSHHVHGHVQGEYLNTSLKGVNSARGSTGEVYFRELDSFFVHQQGLHNELKYIFQYPQTVLQEIALGDLSDFKTEDIFLPTIEGNWEDLNENEMSEYIFHVKRHIVSKTNLRKSFKLVGESPFTQEHYEINFDKSTDTREPIDEGIEGLTIQCNDTRVPIDEGIEVPPLTIQCYDVTFWVNHKMQNLFRKVKPLSEKNMTIEGVMGISKRSTSTTT